MSAAADRRRHPRIPTQLPGQLTPHGGSSHACEVRDYCSGGMLVSVDRDAVATAGFAVGQGVRLAVSLTTDSGLRPINIAASIVWLRDHYLGLQFTRPSDAIVTVLQRNDQMRHAGSPLGTASPGGHNESRCLAKLRHVAQGRLPGLLRELLQTTLQELLESVGRVNSDAERQQVYGDLTSLERLAKRDLLIREVMSNALDPLQEEAHDEALDSGELALVETDDFERWLEASRAATHLERRFSEQVAAIGGRLASLRAEEQPGDLSVPFEPKNFTDALKHAAEELELGSLSRSVLFECSTEVLQDNLGAFYAELQRALDAAGVPQAPARGIQLVRQAIARGSGGHAGDAPGVATQAEVHDEASAAASAFAAHAPAAATPVAGVPNGAMVAVDARTLEHLIERDNRQRESQARELIGTLTDNVGGGPEMQHWLQMIDQSLVNEAVSHPTFFNSNDHPLHSIIDALGHLQMFNRTPYDASVPDEVRDQVNELLRPIAEGEVDTQALNAIAGTFVDLAREQSEHYKRNVERVVEAAEGRERVRLAREAVSLELNARYAGKQVPALLPELIDGGWRSVLELAWLNSSSEPGGFVHQLDLLDAVVFALGGETAADVQSALDRSELFARISAELETAAFDPFRRAALENRLRGALLGSSVQREVLIEMPEQPTDAPTATDAERPPQIPSAVWQQLLDICAAVHLGDRLQFVTGNDAGRTLHVAWIRTDGRYFTLVDHRGIRVRDIGLVELATGLHQRAIRLDQVDGRPLSGRAVDQMLEDMESRLSHLASHDSLTGLMNRRQFQVALEKAVAERGGGTDSRVLLWVDVDQFKLINDIHGYSTGDRLLVAVSSLIERHGSGQTVGHLGADRFAVLMGAATPDQAEQWASHLCEAMRDMPFDWGGPGTALSVSIGAVGLDAVEGIGDLLQAVENALAAAKAAGGDQVYVYRDDDPDLARQRDSVKWVARVDEALVDGELRLRCQPIVPVRSGEGIEPHYEVLLGVADGSKESLPIAEFIEAAERYKRMRAVDRWVTKSVFDWIAAHRDLMPRLYGFAVNLSGQTASDPAFVDFVRQQFQRTAIEPHWISFEVTETAAVASLSGTAGIIHELKALGCMVALDDFGSGLASYSYLKELPVDWLKIDGVFVRDIATDREDYAVVKSINDIGHFLGKKTIAEYVKDQATLELVREIGVDLAQGFGISPPLLMDELVTQLAEQMHASPAASGATAVKG